MTDKFPPNGLVLYIGTIVTDEGKEKKVTFDFEPFRPLKGSLHLCDNKFHIEPLNELLESDDKFGFIVVDGNGTLFETLIPDKLSYADLRLMHHPKISEVLEIDQSHLLATISQRTRPPPSFIIPKIYTYVYLNDYFKLQNMKTSHINTYSCSDMGMHADNRLYTYQPLSLHHAFVACQRCEKVV
ncbi:hypothetical protein POM88_000065 [Heracleum sosnowskyi]|uniref:eRF1/Pelota-like N-terminal domain-containing protein n=1 Tax=Heracleum sosnowskyi TaxID=360622 RepID=A0AAD8J9L3_9APIA|nr:hypothetical protein POM88_000065 [Heracleum sosnowskyi]